MAKKLGAEIDRLFAIREKIREAQKIVDELKEKRTSLEDEIKILMDEQELDKSSGKIATAAISLVIVPKITDWTKWWRYIHQHKAFHLMERRPSAAAYREEVDGRKGKTIPGSEPYTKRNLNLRVREK